MSTAPTGPPPPGAPRILLAEDDPAAAAVAETLLRLSGYEVVLARDGAAALRFIEEGPVPDLLVLDWMLPEVSGIEICTAARRRWDPVALPILMVTARADAASVAAAFESGANDYLTKPFQGSELRARVASHLRIKQLVAERRRIDERMMERENLSSLGLLVGSVAHDLNNPLAGILGHAQLLLEDEADPARAGLLQEIVREVQRCDRIVSDVLSFARRKPADRQRLEPAEVLRATLALRERHLRAAGVRLEVEIEEGAPLVLAAEHQLQQVFLNILINAEQALRAGGDTLRVRLRTLPAGSNPLIPNGGVEIEFENDGPPIPADVLPHIFEPFFTTKAVDEGTGLGLAICARIVRDHRGSIDVHTGESGTVFRLSIPAAASAG